MFEENKNLVTDVTENVEETTEETTVGEPSIEKPIEQEKLYTEEDFNKKLDEVLARKIARKEAKIRKEYDNKYGRVENVLKTGMGVNSIEEATEQLSEFYTEKGISIPEFTSSYNDFDIEAGAEKEANSIIKAGFDEVVEEVDRLAEIGVANMSYRDKLLFNQLASYREKEEKRKELASIGVKDDVLDSNEFNEFANQFNSSTPITKVYELYKKTIPQKEVEQLGSIKNTNTNEVKDYYTPDEVRRLTSSQLDDPEVMKNVEKSMTIWYEKGIR